MAEYDNVADFYDDVYNDPIYWAENTVIERNLAPFAAGARVLDLGAGTGLVAELTDPAFYVAVDNSEDMLGRLREKKVEAFTIVADLTTEEGIAQFRDTALTLGPFDLITSLWAVHYFPTLSLLKVCHELLVPGGSIWLHGNWPKRATRRAGVQGDSSIEYNPDWHAVAGLELAEHAGFVDVCAVGTNAVPDRWLSKFHPDSMPWLIWLSQIRNPKHHYHGAIAGRKFYG